jgi:hypothetical protein
MAAHEKLGAQFTREPDPDYKQMHYQARPASTDPEYPDWVASGARMTVSQHPGEEAYAYGHLSEGRPSERFKMLTDVMNQLRPERGYQARDADYIRQIGEEDIAAGHGRPRVNVTDTGGRAWSGSNLHDKARSDLLQGGPGGQMKLFGSAHALPEVEVRTMSSTKRARIHAPALLAIADRDARQEFGVGLTASTNRSKYSEALTQHLGKATGIPMTERQSTNGSEFMSEYLASPRSTMQEMGQEVSPADVAVARGAVRSLARRPKQAAPPEQSSLF